MWFIPGTLTEHWPALCSGPGLGDTAVDIEVKSPGECELVEGTTDPGDRQGRYREC